MPRAWIAHLRAEGELLLGARVQSWGTARGAGTALGRCWVLGGAGRGRIRQGRGLAYPRRTGGRVLPRRHGVRPQGARPSVAPGARDRPWPVRGIERQASADRVHALRAGDVARTRRRGLRGPGPGGPGGRPPHDRMLRGRPRHAGPLPSRRPCGRHGAAADCGRARRPLLPGRAGLCDHVGRAQPGEHELQRARAANHLHAARGSCSPGGRRLRCAGDVPVLPRAWVASRSYIGQSRVSSACSCQCRFAWTLSCGQHGVPGSGERFSL
mmetsp:Transcript_138576/g.430985  ORF Transcript_138576/g.430985 Transcript_138576/m.430985 type:complete len:269 (-) Transcript_138576:170-976(-)